MKESDMLARHFARTASVLSLIALVSACDRRDEFANVLPTADDVKINVPGEEGQALGLGERSDLYEKTYHISRAINGHVGAVFVILGAIIRTEPTESGDDFRVWGPSEPQGLEDTSYRLTVTRASEGVFDFVLDARPKGTTEEADFKAIWEGQARPVDDETGSGELAIRFDNDRDDCSTGTANVSWTRSADLRTVDIAFDGVDNTCDLDEGFADSYSYSEAADGSGDFHFSMNGNIHRNDENKPGIENLTIVSKWLADGQGRSDVTLTGAEIEADLTTHFPDAGAVDVTIVECWNDLFELTYTTSKPDEMQGFLREEMGEASACAIQ